MDIRQTTSQVTSTQDSGQTNKKEIKMPKNKLKRFAECVTFPNFLQPEFEDVLDGFYLKGKWNKEFFENSNPVILELGCGKGEYTVNLARKYPQKNFIGIDRKGARMWVGGKTSVEEGLVNVGFIRTRLEFITHFFGKDEVSEIWITFPDPQLRKKQVRKRMTSPRYLARYKEFLKPEGIIHLKTDNTVFYEYTLEIIKEQGHELIIKTNDLYSSGPGSYRGELEAAEIQTYYESLHLEEGLKIKYLQFRLNRTNQLNNSKQMRDIHQESFFTKVYEVVKLIPYGRITSYGAIANYLGSKGSARMVGWAMNASLSSQEPVPAHRVVNRSGLLTGKHHFGSPDIMQQLLESEGIKVENDKIIDFENHFWDPVTELK